MAIYIIPFIAILFFSIWLTSEFNSRAAKKQNTKFSKMIAEQNRELSELRSQLNSGQSHERQKNTEIVVAEKRAREIERRYNQIANKYKRLNEAVLVIQEKLNSKDYKGNGIARFVLEEFGKVTPVIDLNAREEDAKTKQAFERIKGKLGGEEAAG